MVRSWFGTGGESLVSVHIDTIDPALRSPEDCERAIEDLSLLHLWYIRSLLTGQRSVRREQIGVHDPSRGSAPAIPVSQTARQEHGGQADLQINGILAEVWRRQRTGAVISLEATPPQVAADIDTLRQHLCTLDLTTLHRIRIGLGT